MHLKRRRIEYSGAIYHVTQRGNNHESIFKDVIDKNYYLKLLRLYKEKCDFKLLGYSIMDNHYHLLLKTEATPLNKIMHRIGTKYSRYYNMKNERTGHVFSDRYTAGLIQDEKYLFSALRYIHWNAVRAGICATVSEYPWSSDHAYRSNDRKMVSITCENVTCFRFKS
ncbi:MAG: transposase [Bacillota bacterium]|nr:transposase [Bacillota bacterium]